MLSGNNHLVLQDTENDHNIVNNNIINLIENFSSKDTSNNKFDDTSSYKADHIIAKSNNSSNQEIMKCDVIQICQDTNNNSNNSRESSFSQNDTSSSSASSSTTSMSPASSSVLMCEQLATEKALNNKVEKKEVRCKYDCQSYESKIDKVESQKIDVDDDDDDDDETIDVDDFTQSNVRSTSEASPIDINDKTSPLNYSRDNNQPLLESTEDTIMILKQLMDKRIELKRLDKMVFNLITHHLMKITSTSNASANYESTKSILSNTFDHLSDLQVPNARYNHNSSSNEDCSNLHSVERISDNKGMSETQGIDMQQYTSARSNLNANNGRLTADHLRVVTDNRGLFDDISLSNSSMNFYSNQSLIDLTSTSSRHPSKISSKNHANFHDSETLKKSDHQLFNGFVSPSNDDNLFSGRQKLLHKIHLSDYDGISNREALKLTSSIYGQSEELKGQPLNSSRNLPRNDDDCTSMTGLNLKTNNTCSTMDQSISLLQNMHHSTHIPTSPIASTSFSLHAMASLHNSHYLNALNNNNNSPLTHNLTSLDALNKQNNINNPPNATPSNDICLNYSSHDREQSFYATAYKQINSTSNRVGDFHQANGKISLPNSVQHHQGESLLRPPIYKKFRTSFSEKPSKSATSNSLILSQSDGATQKSSCLYEGGPLDFNHQRPLDYHQDLDLPQKYCQQKSSQQQFQNPAMLTTDAVSPPSSTPSASLLAYKQQHSQLKYQHDFANSSSSDPNTDSTRSSCNIVENGSSNTNAMNNNGTCRLVCHVCGSGFEDRHRLQQHLSIHLQLKPEWYSESTIKETMAQYEAKRGDYLCGQCNERFDTTAEFDKHMQQHGDKPHRCELCFHDNSFRYWRQYLTHFRNHCFVYHCRFVKGCNHQCNRRDYLKSHILKHHLDNRLPEQYTG